MPRPAPVLAWFLAGSFLATITEGLVIVFVLDGTSLASRSHRTAGGWVNVAAGAAALVGAAWLRARPPRPHRTKPSRWTARVERGGAYTFGAGVVLNVFPGVFPLVALRDIAALDASDGAKAACVVLLYVIMFTLIEVPLAGLVVAPARVRPMVRRLNEWLDRNARRLALNVLASGGLLLVVRGILQLTGS